MLIYTQLFATFSNLGGTWPRYFVLKGVDFFSVASCQIGEDLAVQGLWSLDMLRSPPTESYHSSHRMCLRSRESCMRRTWRSVRDG